MKLSPLWPCVSLGLFVLALSSPAADPPKPASVVKVLDLFERLHEAEKPGSKSPKVNFSLTDTEINEYLQYSLKATPRPGLQSITVKVFPYNYLSNYVILDFDAVEKWKPGTIPMLLRPVLSGSKAILLDLRFNAQDGKTTFTVEKAYFQQIPLPAFFVQKMIEIVAARQPEHYDTTKPIPLPFGLRKASTADKVISGEN